MRHVVARLYGLAAALLVAVAPGCGAPPGPTWSTVYAQWFAADATTGHCARGGCHAPPGNSGFVCGPTAADCYRALTGAPIAPFNQPLIDTAHPEQSLLLDPARSPVAWFNPNGIMPQDFPDPNAAARDAIRAWVLAGAPE